ncbi:MAG: DinB family protein [Gemmatimonadaceae bacterium]|nr:DinB family protein [Gemmatimonadaceae bacterium]
MSSPFRSIRPVAGEYASYYASYIARVPDGDIVETLDRQISESLELFRSIPESLGDHRYAPGKWSIREVIGHIADAERVFAYRALRFSRADTTPVAGFDENAYVSNAPFARTSLADLASGLEHVRRASLYLFAGLDEEAMTRRGIANGFEVSVRALAWITAGHETHHIDVLRARYLTER